MLQFAASLLEKPYGALEVAIVARVHGEGFERPRRLDDVSHGRLPDIARSTAKRRLCHHVLVEIPTGVRFATDPEVAVPPAAAVAGDPGTPRRI
jgi:hypothetical protein